MKTESRKDAERRAVVLLSGGLDSAANLAISTWLEGAARPVLALTVDYGQRAVNREIEAARQLASFYRVEHRVIDLKWLGRLGGSALTDPRLDLPHFERNELDEREITERSAEAVWVPNRNGLFINLASAIAESIGADEILVGFNAEEAATFPDNTVEFMSAATHALSYSTANSVRVHSHTADLDKVGIVTRLLQLDPEFPFDLLWSCYEGDREHPCGECESCQRLSRARERAVPAVGLRSGQTQNREFSRAD